jgi:hypothetical protein
MLFTGIRGGSERAVEGGLGVAIFAFGSWSLREALRVMRSRE